jgi:predicted nucleic acid-binding protein
LILVDTSVWIDHLRNEDALLKRLLGSGSVLCHPAVVCEIALGNLRKRDSVLGALRGLPEAMIHCREHAGRKRYRLCGCASPGVGQTDAGLALDEG